ncbi:MAG TPA: hypothetical protein VNT29_10510 [Candidatus Limnocylindrales bacterium]|nr:hypothetical protein [Candidatus Limnocylindrales bacterium]
MTVWHGLTTNQVKTLWSQFSWEEWALATLHEVAACEDAAIETRMLALNSLDFFVREEVVKTNVFNTVPEFVGRVLVSICRPRKRRGWWARRRAKRVAEDMAARLTAARTLLLTIHGFMEKEKQVGGGEKSIAEKFLS